MGEGRENLVYLVTKFYLYFTHEVENWSYTTIQPTTNIRIETRHLHFLLFLPISLFFLRRSSMSGVMRFLTPFKEVLEEILNVIKTMLNVVLVISLVIPPNKSSSWAKSTFKR